MVYRLELELLYSSDAPAYSRFMPVGKLGFGDRVQIGQRLSEAHPGMNEVRGGVFAECAPGCSGSTPSAPAFPRRRGFWKLHKPATARIYAGWHPAWIARWAFI